MASSIQFGANPPGSFVTTYDQIDVLVSVSNAAGTPVSQWTLISVPEGSGTTLSGDTDPVATFTPDLPGSYLIQLQCTDGTSDRRIYGIATDLLGLRPPAEYERNETTNGWSEEVNRTLTYVGYGSLRGSTALAYNNTGGTLTRGNAVKLINGAHGGALEITGLAENTDVESGVLLACIASRLDGSPSVPDTAFCIVTTSGIVPGVTIGGSPVGGEPYTITISDTTPGEFKYAGYGVGFQVDSSTVYFSPHPAPAMHGSTHAWGAADPVVGAIPLDESPQIYVSADDGSDTTGTGSRALPYETLQKAIEEAPATATIVAMGLGPYDGISVSDAVLGGSNKNLVITSECPLTEFNFSDTRPSLTGSLSFEADLSNSVTVELKGWSISPTGDLISFSTSQTHWVEVGLEDCVVATSNNLVSEADPDRCRLNVTRCLLSVTHVTEDDTNYLNSLSLNDTLLYLDDSLKCRAKLLYLENTLVMGGGDPSAGDIQPVWAEIYMLVKRSFVLGSYMGSWYAAGVVVDTGGASLSCLDSIISTDMSSFPSLEAFSVLLHDDSVSIAADPVGTPGTYGSIAGDADNFYYHDGTQWRTAGGGSEVVISTEADFAMLSDDTYDGSTFIVEAGTYTFDNDVVLRGHREVSFAPGVVLDFPLGHTLVSANYADSNNYFDGGYTEYVTFDGTKFTSSTALPALDMSGWTLVIVHHTNNPTVVGEAFRVDYISGNDIYVVGTPEQYISTNQFNFVLLSPASDALRLLGWPTINVYTTGISLYYLAYSTIQIEVAHEDTPADGRLMHVDGSCLSTFDIRCFGYEIDGSTTGANTCVLDFSRSVGLHLALQAKQLRNFSANADARMYGIYCWRASNIVADVSVSGVAAKVASGSGNSYAYGAYIKSCYGVSLVGTVGGQYASGGAVSAYGARLWSCSYSAYGSFAGSVTTS